VASGKEGVPRVAAGHRLATASSLPAEKTNKGGWMAVTLAVRRAAKRMLCTQLDLIKPKIQLIFQNSNGRE